MALAIDHAGFDRATADREDRPERIAGAEHVLAGAQRPDVSDQALLFGQPGLVAAGRPLVELG